MGMVGGFSGEGLQQLTPPPSPSQTYRPFKGPAHVDGFYFVGPSAAVKFS